MQYAPEPIKIWPTIIKGVIAYLAPMKLPICVIPYKQAQVDRALGTGQTFSFSQFNQQKESKILNQELIQCITLIE